jgi:ABC-type phosphate transport system permease subunit
MTYARRAGPLVAILEGTFEPEQADKILGSLEFQYSIRWIYDKNNRSSATVWGVPVGLLGTVVRSLAFVALLCVASVLLGLGMAVFRILLREYAPNNILDRPERTEMIRLKLDEN